MLVGILAAWFLLQGRVKALEVKFGDLVTREQANKQQFVDLVKTVQKIHDNQLIIGVTLGVKGLRE